MELRQLRYFATLARTLHFRRAAEQLHIAQPTLSQQIQQLEKELGVELFQRNRQGVSLTYAGETLLARTEAILNDVETAISETRLAEARVATQLTIGYVDTAAYLLIPQLTRLFYEQYPGGKLSLIHITPQQQVEALQSHLIDFGITYRLPGGKPTDVTSLSLFHDPFMAVLPQSHPYVQQPIMQASRLNGEPFIWLTRSNHNLLYDRTLRQLNEQGIHPVIVQEASTKRAILELVASNLGISVLPQSTQMLGVNEVVFRPIDAFSLSLELVLNFQTDNDSDAKQYAINLIQQIATNTPR